MKMGVNIIKSMTHRRKEGKEGNLRVVTTFYLSFGDRRRRKRGRRLISPALPCLFLSLF